MNTSLASFLRVRIALMCLVSPALSTKVHRRVTGVIIGRLLFLISPSEALDAGRSLYQRPVHTEMLVRQQLLTVCLHYHLVEQCLAYTVLQ